MSRFRRLTDAEARTLTRRELLDRIEAEQAYWFRKKARTPGDDAAFREFTRIMYACLSPASIAEAMQDTIDYIEGRGPGRYWDTRGYADIPLAVPLTEVQAAEQFPALGIRLGDPRPHVKGKIRGRRRRRSPLRTGRPCGHLRGLRARRRRRHRASGAGRPAVEPGGAGLLGHLRPCRPCRRAPRVAEPCENTAWQSLESASPNRPSVQSWSVPVL